jgi:sec-independent protein translocase protein TatC
MAKTPKTSAAKKFSEEDYFAHTTMTFGEHLEELRRALLRAVIGIVVGFCIGMVLASSVVRYVQHPLERAMERYYINVAVEENPAMRQLSADERLKVAREMIHRNLSYSYMYLEVDELERLLAEYKRLASSSASNTQNASSAGQTTTSRAQPTNAQASGAQPSDAHPSHTQSPDAQPPQAQSAEARPSNLEASNAEPSHPPAERPPDPNAPMIKVRVWTPVKAQITALGAEEPFMIWLKAAFIVGLVIAAPYAFYQIWTFVAAGLYPHEKRYVHVFLPISLLLFILGVSTAFFLVFDPVLDFLLQFNRSMNIDPDPRISNWMTFVLILPLGFGIAFQLPLVMLFVNRLGIVSLKTMADNWRIAIFVIAVLSAVLTPADPISMIAMALPLTILYFLGLGMCYWMPPIRRPDEVYE